MRGNEVSVSSASSSAAAFVPSARSRPYAPGCVPVSTTSSTPDASSACASATIARTGRARSRPRTRGTMQKAQTSSQPSWILRKARVRPVAAAPGPARSPAGGERRSACRTASAAAAFSRFGSTMSAPVSGRSNSPAHSA